MILFTSQRIIFRYLVANYDNEPSVLASCSSSHLYRSFAGRKNQGDPAKASQSEFMENINIYPVTGSFDMCISSAGHIGTRVVPGPPRCGGLFRGIASPAILCHKEPAWASKISPNGYILRSKAPSRGLWMPELVLYGMRLLAKQFLGTILDIEVDHSGPIRRDCALIG